MIFGSFGQEVFIDQSDFLFDPAPGSLQSLLLIVDDKTGHAMVDNFWHGARRNAMTAVPHEIKTDRSLAAEFLSLEMNWHAGFHGLDEWNLRRSPALTGHA
jgi:hypothetical protein